MTYFTILSINFFMILEKTGQFSEKIINPRGGWGGEVCCFGLCPKNNRLFFCVPSLFGNQTFSTQSELRYNNMGFDWQPADV